ncbi:WhiB family transcriptional regulator [Streptomyces sp. NPDC046821]|uniref:WhiB family transcriptional regulator n=1 Tax=Streptomyces sp. NPDC046821 TaxID=3154702 RepID=UPI0033C59CDD
MTGPTLTELVAAIVRRDDWRHLASCTGYDPETFFPVGTTSLELAKANEAKAVCRRCPVREHCLQWAQEAYIADGIWGGHTPKEREALRRRAARQKRSAASAAPASEPAPARASPQQ